MSVRGAIFLGVGSMVGAGIFALLGEAGAVAGVRRVALVPARRASSPACSATPSSSSACATRPRAGSSRTSSQGFGNGRLVGIASWLGYIAAIVIVGAMVAVSFGSYATALFIGDDAGPGVGQRLHHGSSSSARSASTSSGRASSTARSR